MTNSERAVCESALTWLHSCLGMILLSGLFLYDCWFVFGTSVMVTVATSFEAPIKMVWPKDSASKPSFTMLGLGDIVLPGLFIALSLRYDYSRFTRSVAVTATGDQKECNSAPHRAMASLSTKYAKPYFWSVFSAYIAGLVTTIFVMHHFQAAQPALLYLSPACIFSVVFCSILRGDKDVWKFKDMNEEGPGESKSQSETSTPKQDRDKERKPSQNSDADNTNSFLLQTPESS